MAEKKLITFIFIILLINTVFIPQNNLFVTIENLKTPTPIPIENSSQNLKTTTLNISNPIKSSEIDYPLASDIYYQIQGNKNITDSYNLNNISNDDWLDYDLTNTSISLENIKPYKKYNLYGLENFSVLEDFSNAPGLLSITDTIYTHLAILNITNPSNQNYINFLVDFYCNFTDTYPLIGYNSCMVLDSNSNNYTIQIWNKTRHNNSATISFKTNLTAASWGLYYIYLLDSPLIFTYYIDKYINSSDASYYYYNTEKDNDLITLRIKKSNHLTVCTIAGTTVSVSRELNNIGPGLWYVDGAACTPTICNVSKGPLFLEIKFYGNTYFNTYYDTYKIYRLIKNTSWIYTDFHAAYNGSGTPSGYSAQNPFCTRFYYTNTSSQFYSGCGSGVWTNTNYLGFAIPGVPAAGSYEYLTIRDDLNSSGYVGIIIPSYGLSTDIVYIRTNTWSSNTRYLTFQDYPTSPDSNLYQKFRYHYVLHNNLSSIFNDQKNNNGNYSITLLNLGAAIGAPTENDYSTDVLIINYTQTGVEESLGFNFNYNFLTSNPQYLYISLNSTINCTLHLLYYNGTQISNTTIYGDNTWRLHNLSIDNYTTQIFWINFTDNIIDYDTSQIIEFQMIYDSNNTHGVISDLINDYTEINRSIFWAPTNFYFESGGSSGIVYNQSAIFEADGQFLYLNNPVMPDNYLNISFCNNTNLYTNESDTVIFDYNYYLFIDANVKIQLIITFTDSEHIINLGTYLYFGSYIWINGTYTTNKNILSVQLLFADAGSFFYTDVQLFVDRSIIYFNRSTDFIDNSINFTYYGGEIKLDYNNLSINLYHNTTILTNLFNYTIDLITIYGLNNTFNIWLSGIINGTNYNLSNYDDWAEVLLQSDWDKNYQITNLSLHFWLDYGNKLNLSLNIFKLYCGTYGSAEKLNLSVNNVKFIDSSPAAAAINYRYFSERYYNFDYNFDYIAADVDITGYFLVNKSINLLGSRQFTGFERINSEIDNPVIKIYGTLLSNIKIKTNSTTWTLSNFTSSLSGSIPVSIIPTDSINLVSLETNKIQDNETLEFWATTLSDNILQMATIINYTISEKIRVDNNFSAKYYQDTAADSGNYYYLSLNQSEFNSSLVIQENILLIEQPRPFFGVTWSGWSNYQDITQIPGSDKAFWYLSVESASNFSLGEWRTATRGFNLSSDYFIILNYQNGQVDEFLTIFDNNFTHTDDFTLIFNTSITPQNDYYIMALNNRYYDEIINQGWVFQDWIDYLVLTININLNISGGSVNGNLWDYDEYGFYLPNAPELPDGFILFPPTPPYLAPWASYELIQTSGIYITVKDELEREDWDKIVNYKLFIIYPRRDYTYRLNISSYNWHIGDLISGDDDYNVHKSGNILYFNVSGNKDIKTDYITGYCNPIKGFSLYYKLNRIMLLAFEIDVNVTVTELIINVVNVTNALANTEELEALNGRVENVSQIIFRPLILSEGAVNIQFNLTEKSFLEMYLTIIVGTIVVSAVVIIIIIVLYRSGKNPKLWRRLKLKNQKAKIRSKTVNIIKRRL